VEGGASAFDKGVMNRCPKILVGGAGGGLWTKVRRKDLRGPLVVRRKTIDPYDTTMRENVQKRGESAIRNREGKWKKRKRIFWHAGRGHREKKKG